MTIVNCQSVVKLTVDYKSTISGRKSTIDCKIGNPMNNWSRITYEFGNETKNCYNHLKMEFWQIPKPLGWLKETATILILKKGSCHCVYKIMSHYTVFFQMPSTFMTMQLANFLFDCLSILFNSMRIPFSYSMRYNLLQ